MSHPSATQILDELIAQLGDGSGPRERLIQEHVGSIVHPARNAGIHQRADAAVQELRQTWGPTVDPSRVDGILPGRGNQPDQSEFDCYFALFRRSEFWGYVRIRAPETDTPEKAYLRLVLGVIRNRGDDAG